MPTVTTIPVGAPCWMDVYTSDPAGARAFYGDLFGWTSESAGDEFGGYVNFSKDGALVAGLMGAGADSPMSDFWTVYLVSADAEQTVGAAAAHGGQVVVPATPVGDLGRMAVLADSGGAGVGLWEPGEHAGFGVFGEPGAPCWFELHTRAYESSIDFYRQVFGWDTYVASDDPSFRYTTLGAGEDQRAGVMDAGWLLPEGVSGQWSVYFGVDDTDAALARVVELGGSVVRPADDSPYGRLAEVADPFGAHFKLVDATS